MAMPNHVYRIKNMENGATVKRIGHDNYYAARRLAVGWAATLERETGVPHAAVKMRNAYGKGLGRGAPLRPPKPAPDNTLRNLENAVRTVAAQPGAGATVALTAGPLRIVCYSQRRQLVYYLHGRRSTRGAAVQAQGQYIGEPHKVG